MPGREGGRCAGRLTSLIFECPGSLKRARYNHIADAVKLLTPILLLASAAAAQQPLVLLDPARGGPQSGAHVADRVEEKQVTLQVAQRLASLLKARGFAVEMTRDGDTDVSNDSRAALANTTHPIACILLHASATGQGVHLFTTTLARPATVDPSAAVAWDSAQAAYAARSHALAEALRETFSRTRLGVTSGTTWTRPMDNMQCPAVVVEMGPQKDGTSADDPPYQNKVADTVAGTLLFWKNKVGGMTPPAPPPPPKPEPVVPKPLAPAPAKDATAPKPAVPVVPKAATPAVPKPTTPAVPKPAVPVAPKAPVPNAPKAAGVAQ